MLIVIGHLRTRDKALYIACVILFGAYKVLEQFDPDIPLIHAYFEDFLAIPIVLKTAQLAVQLIRESWRNQVFSLREVTVITVLFALYFEGIMPELSDRFTRDLWDVFCYAAGALLFWEQMNRPLLNTGDNA